MAQLVRVFGTGPNDLRDRVERFWLDGEPIELSRDLEIDSDLLQGNIDHFLQWYEERLDGLPNEAKETARRFIEQSIAEGGVSDDGEE